MSIIRLYFSFGGRISRSVYWLGYILPYTLVNLFFNLVDVFVDSSNGLSVILSIFLLITFWAELAGTAKRFHDLDKSAWSILLLLIPFVNLWFFIKLGFLRGTTGSNQYGPDPQMPNAFAFGSATSTLNLIDNQPDDVDIMVQVAQELLADGSLSRAEYELLRSRLPQFSNLGDFARPLDLVH